ncbi:unnamed protein product, partial [Coregonus sp. 'balchen']
MSKLQLLNVFLNEKLTAVPLELSVVIKKTIAEYQEEISRLKRANARLRRLLDLVFKPEVKPFSFPPDLQQLTITEERVNHEEQHCEQEWSPGLGPGPVESDAEEFIWDSFNIMSESDGENQTESDGESYIESESTSDYQPPSEVNPGSDDNEIDKGKADGVGNRIRPLESKRGRGRPRKHASELPELICEVCGKRLATAHGLRRHRQLRHSEERPYTCDTCGQSFAMNFYLRKHMKIHMGERQQCCTDCGKRVKLGRVPPGPRPGTYDPNESQAELSPDTFGY